MYFEAFCLDATNTTQVKKSFVIERKQKFLRFIVKHDIELEKFGPTYIPYITCLKAQTYVA